MVNWKVISTVLTVIGGVISIVGGIAEDRKRSEEIREEVRNEIERQKEGES